MRQIITHFTDDDLYKFTMCCAVIDNWPRAVVKYRFTDRDDHVYPQGFAAELENQIRMLENVVITDYEIEFMKRRCAYIPHWFYNFLRGFRYDHRWVKVSQDTEGHLSLDIEGNWSSVILLEVKLLAIISELNYIMSGEAETFDTTDYYDRTFEKGRRLIEAGCYFSEFGTRRRASAEIQRVAVEALRDADAKSGGPGRFTGTSNVYLAMEYDLTPIGTMAHEIVCGVAGMYGPQMANHLAMSAWRKTYRGALGTFLYDTYGWHIFSLNFSEDYANMFKGLRVDSGDNYAELDRIVEKYKSLGIDSRSKQVIFSNALSTDSAIEIQAYAKSRCLPSFGIGTHFTNNIPGVRPMNIVIKLVAIKITETWDFFNGTCKLSQDAGKHAGDDTVVERFKQAIHFEQ